MSELRLTGRRVSLGDISYESLREAIVSLKLAPCETVTEGRLSSDLGISRPILREAIQRLQTEGLLERQSNGRLRVSATSVEEVHHLYAVRAAIARVAVTEAVARVDEEQLALLQQAIDQFRRDTDLGDAEVLVRSGTRFHTLIFEIAGNPVNTAVLEILRPRIDRYRHISVRSARERPRQSLAELQRVFEAFRSGDAEAASHAMAAHIAESERAAAESLRSAIGMKLSGRSVS